MSECARAKRITVAASSSSFSSGDACPSVLGQQPKKKQDKERTNSRSVGRWGGWKGGPSHSLLSLSLTRTVCQADERRKRKGWVKREGEGEEEEGTTSQGSHF